LGWPSEVEIINCTNIRAAPPLEAALLNDDDDYQISGRQSATDHLPAITLDSRRRPTMMAAAAAIIFVRARPACRRPSHSRAPSMTLELRKKRIVQKLAHSLISSS
jgi:hypothetical protein